VDHAVVVVVGDKKLLNTGLGLCSKTEEEELTDVWT
jgi:hypothetical protein